MFIEDDARHLDEIMRLHFENKKLAHVINTSPEQIHLNVKAQYPMNDAPENIKENINPDPKQHRNIFIAITGAKSGLGVTTIASNLATLITRFGVKVLIADAGAGHLYSFFDSSLRVCVQKISVDPASSLHDLITMRGGICVLQDCYGSDFKSNINLWMDFLRIWNCGESLNPGIVIMDIHSLFFLITPEIQPQLW
ncbi:MAG: hypothetical protein HQM11_20950 [SAR324 cluster bacterium]|nr:hypothetical protein [SAR324 cluster bacterium]